MRITFIIYSLSAGGAQRVVVDLAGRITARGHQVTLVTYSRKEEDHFGVPSGVQRVSLELLWNSKTLWDGLRSNLARVKMLRAAVTQTCPDVVVSFIDLTNVITLVSLLGTGIPVVISERVHPAYHAIGTRWRLARQLTYFLASSLVVQTRSIAQWARRVAAPSKIQVIPNAAPDWRPANASSRSRMVLAVGRLHQQKGFDLLLQAFAGSRICESGWTLVLLGEGAERHALEQLANGLGLTDVVRFPGATDDPRRWMEECGIFVLSSRFEGFPNVLLEAMSTGAPCIAFDCPSGPSDIIEADRNGILVPVGDVAGLSSALEALANSPVTRMRLGEQACHVQERFASDKVTEHWLSVISTCCRRPPTEIVA